MHSCGTGSEGGGNLDGNLIEPVNIGGNLNGNLARH